MIQGSVIRDYYIDLWRRVPDIVAAMDDDEARIRKSGDITPQQATLEGQVVNAGAPSITVAYQGYSKTDRRLNEVTRHLIVAFIRAATLDDDAHEALAWLMTEAVPLGEDLPIRYLPGDDADFDPMDFPKLERITLPEPASTDIRKLSFFVPERAG